jgi:CubicO group peptidase (beta-lactamase class C family)
MDQLMNANTAASRAIIRYSLISVVLFVAACAPALPATPAVTLEPSPVTVDAPERMNEAGLAELETYILESMGLAEIPGMSIAIVQNGEVIYTKGFGVRELGRNEPVTPDTLMMIASSTKPLTTLMMATVVDDGLVSWETTVTSILPSFAVADPDLTRRLAMRHLVCACSGMPGKDSALFLSDLKSAEDLILSMQVIAPVSEFEKEFNYSNQMVAAGGYVAALAANGPGDDLGAGYVAAMQERVFDPIGMTHTTLSIAKVQAGDNYARPHGLDLTSHYQPLDLSAEKFVSSVLPAGGVWSTANDMSRLLVTELNQGIAPDGKRIVSVENLSKTWEPQVEIKKGTASYGLGWIIEDYHGMRLIHHSGNSMGFSADFALLPAAGLGVVVLTNAEGAGDFVHAIRYRLFEIAFGFPSQHDAVFKKDLDASRKGVADFAKILLPIIDAQAISPYLGTFTNDELGDINLSMDDGRLMMVTGGLTSELRQLSALGRKVFAVYDVPWVVLGQWTLQFETDSKGNPKISLFEKGVYEPFVFVKSSRP